MKRFLLSQFIVAVCTLSARAEEFSMPSTVAPRVTGASAVESRGTVQVHLIFTRTVAEERTRIVMRDGAKSEEKYTVSKPVFESKVVELAGDVKAFTREGKEIDSKDVLARLKNPTPVVLSEDGKLDAFYRSLFRDDTIVLAIPSTTLETGAPVGPLRAGAVGVAAPAVRIRVAPPAPAPARN